MRRATPVQTGVQSADGSVLADTPGRAHHVSRVVTVIRTDSILRLERRPSSHCRQMTVWPRETFRNRKCQERKETLKVSRQTVDCV